MSDVTITAQRPTSGVNGSSTWTNIANAYDNSLTTYASRAISSSVTAPWIDFTFDLSSVAAEIGGAAVSAVTGATVTIRAGAANASRANLCAGAMAASAPTLNTATSLGSLTTTATDYTSALTTDDMSLIRDAVSGAIVVPAPTSGFFVTDDGTNIIISFKGTLTISKCMFLINADGNTATGYNYDGTNMGYDYYVDWSSATKCRLYQYTGTAGSSTWSWSQISSFTPVAHTNTTAESSVTIPFSTLGITIGSSVNCFCQYNSATDYFYTRQIGAVDAYSVHFPVGASRVSSSTTAYIYDVAISFTLTLEAVDSDLTLFYWVKPTGGAIASTEISKIIYVDKSGVERIDPRIYENEFMIWDGEGTIGDNVGGGGDSGGGDSGGGDSGGGDSGGGDSGGGDSGGGDSGGGDSGGGDSGDIAITTTYSFTEDFSDFCNPWRGWYRMYEDSAPSTSSLTSMYNNFNPLLLWELTLPSSGTPSTSTLSTTLSRCRSGGIGVMFRAAYDWSGASKPEPTSISTLLSHIDSVAAVLAPYEDIILSVHAGMFGPWGEWHTSYYDGSSGSGTGLPSQTYREQVITEWMNTLPASIPINLRRPRYMRDATGWTATQNADTAYTNTRQGRIAYHNDGYLYSSTDAGTFDSLKGANNETAYNATQERAWVPNHTLYTPFSVELFDDPGGNTLNQAPAAGTRMALDHVNNIHSEYDTDVLNLWVADTTTYPNFATAYKAFGAMMGYRFRLTSAGFGVSGNTLRCQLNLRNDGWGNLTKQQEIALVLKRDGYTDVELPISDDPRFWECGTAFTKDYYLTLPSGIASGTWAAYLRIRPAFSTLYTIYKFYIRLANTGVWSSTTGLNALGNITI